MTGGFPEPSPAFLYIGGSHPQRRAIEGLREAGLFVVLTDRSEDAPARSVADAFAPIDATSCAAIVRLSDTVARDRPLIGAYAVADYAVPGLAAVAQRHRLKGPRFEAADLFTDKALTSERLRSVGIPVPHLYWSGSTPESPPGDVLDRCEGRDLVVKPRDANNSRGVTVLKRASQDAILAALEGLNDVSRHAMIEAWCDGAIGNVDGLVADSVFHPISTTVRRNDPGQPVVCTAMIQPAGLPGHDARAFGLAARVATAIGYDSGPITIDLVIGGDGSLSVLEVSPHFHNVQCEIARGNGNPMAAYGAWLLGRPDWRRHLAAADARHGACCQIFVTGSGVMSRVAGLTEIAAFPGVVDIDVRLQPGSRVAGPNGQKVLMCLVWAAAGTREELDRIIERVERGLSAIFIDSHG